MTSQLRSELTAVSELLRRATLRATSLNEALRLMRLYARFHWDNISGVFGDEALEQAVFEIWQKDLPPLDPRASDPAPPNPTADRPFDVLHVATQLYHQGGHSRLLRHLLAGLADSGSQGLVLTDRRAKNDLADLPVAPISLSGSPVARVRKLLELGAQAGTILLHIHPDDSAAALAARLLRQAGKRVLFVNHADHVFTLGPGAANAVLEICATGWGTTAHRRSAVAQSFMGIPIADAQNSDPIWQQDRSGPIVSMGGPGKFKPGRELSFPDFAQRILSRVDNDLILIGPSAKEPWWSDLAARFPDRLQLLGSQPPAVVTEIMRKAACYVDSFPVDGGTAYPQTALMGVPCFGPNADNASGVTPAEILRFATLPQMEEAIVTFVQTGAYPFDLAAIRAGLQADFSTQAVTARVVSAAQGHMCPLPPALKQVGSRGPDYNALRWEDDGVLYLPKRQWRGLSLATRSHLLRDLSQDISQNISAGTLKTLRRRICTKWV